MRENSDVLQHQLCATQALFLTSVAQGDHTLVEFDHHWNTLVAKVIRGVKEGWLQKDVALLAHNTATLIATYVDSLAACSEKADSVVVDVKDALARLTLSDTVYPSSSFEGYQGQYLSPPYIQAAYDWLMDNIHNPYPTSLVKRDLASCSGLSTRQIHDWFKTVRRSIGWIDFCKKHFAGSRSLAIEATTQVLSGQSTSRQIPLEIEVDILSLRGAAECLYPAFRTNSISTSDSSRWSPFLPTVSSTLIRHGDVCTVSRHPMQSDEHRGSTIPFCNKESSLVSPISEVPSKIDDRIGISETSTSSALPLISSHPRKRRLSDTSAEDVRKKARLLPGEPRKQIVSDPLPRSSTEDLDAFWRDLFNLTLPSLVPDTDASRPLSIVPQETSDHITSLSPLYASLMLDNGETLPPPALPSHTQLSYEVLPFADPTLEMASTEEPVPKSGTNLEQLLSSFATQENLFDFSACSSDSLSDTSSILTLSPPRTPTLSSSSLPRSSNSTFDFDPTSPSDPFAHCQTAASSVLDEIYLEKDIEKTFVSCTFSLTELDDAFPRIPFDLSDIPLTA